MKNFLYLMTLILALPLQLMHSHVAFAAVEVSAAQEQEKGPHRGRLLKDGDFVVELSIFETGVPPEFRVWITEKGQAVDPREVDLKVTLTRLGGIQDLIQFSAQNDFLRGDSEIYEPHSFAVAVEAIYRNKKHAWQYDNFEGRVKIETAVAQALQITTSNAGSEVLTETVSVYGKLIHSPNNQRNISARFDGTITKVNVSLGQRVKRGDLLLTIESNESLKSYAVYAPIDGVVQKRDANEGEQTDGRVLLTLLDNKTLSSELAVFPADRHRVAPGAKVWLSVKGVSQPVSAVITQIDSSLQPNQSVIARAHLDNASGHLLPGTFVQGEIEIASFRVPLAVKRSGLQAFRDFTVVFEKIGDEYEVRMLELGRVAGQWVEVLGGLKPGAEYVSGNSYIIKADIEKTGASHDH